MAGRSPALTGRRRRRRRAWSRTSKTSSSPRSPSHSSPPFPAQQATPMPPGTEVEVRVDDDGFHGSWFEASVDGFVPARGRRSARYTVTYSHLLSDDGATLVEPFAPSHLRPRPPPPTSPEETLRLHDIVEAFHNDGWWSGIVLATDPLTVAFPITREVITFPPHLVRPRRDYVDGQWVPSQAAMVVQPKLAVSVYEVGDKVEVVRDREVYGYSWFPATVAKVIDRLSYLVEYFDLEEGEGGAKVMEYLHWRFIRPAVEHSPRESEFRLGPGAAVEAYCDGAWSPGVVCWVVGESEYEVSVDGKEYELLLTKVPELLKPQYKWNGKHWRIVSPKDSYQAALNSSEHLEDSEQHDLDGKVLYTIGGGLPHGRLPIGNGDVKKADIIAAAKGRNIRPSNTPSYRALLQENAQLHQQQEVQGRMIMITTLTEDISMNLLCIINLQFVVFQMQMLFEKLGEEPPVEMMCRQPPSQVQGTGSSHVGSQVAHKILDEEIGSTQAVDGNMGGEDNGNTIFHVPNNDAADNAGVDQANNGTS